MAFSTNFLITLLVMIFVAGGTYIIWDIRRLRSEPKAGKQVINYNYRYNDSNKFGKLIKREFIGSGRRMVRIKYQTLKYDDEDEPMMVQNFVIAPKELILEDEDHLQVLPKSPEDIDLKVVRSDLLKSYIRNEKDFIVTQIAHEKQYDNLARIAINSLGGEASEKVINRVKTAWEKIAIEKEEKKGKEDKK